MAEGRFERLLDGLASDRPVPAGGSAAAAAVALAAALLEKAAKLAVSRWEGAPAALEEAHRLRLHAEDLIEADALAYQGLVEARRAARQPAPEAALEALADAEAETVRAPLAIAQAGVEVQALARRLGDHGNPNLAADAAIAALLAGSGAEAAAGLVAVNLGRGSRDPRLAAAKRLLSAARG